MLSRAKVVALNQQNSSRQLLPKNLTEIIGPTKDRGDMTGLIIKNGFIVSEWGDINRVDMTFSISKTYLSTVIGVAWIRAYPEC